MLLLVYLIQCFSPQGILQWATEHFGKSRILKKSCLNFLFSGNRGRKNRLYFGEDFFFFWRSPVFGRKNRLYFGEDFFFFWRSPVFGRKNRLNFGEDLFFFFFFGDHLFSAGKIVSMYLKTDLGQVLKQCFESGPWKIFKIKMGHSYKKVGNH